MCPRGAGPRTPRRGGWADGTTKALVGRLARERCPALRSAGLFGSETGPPKLTPCFLSTAQKAWGPQRSRAGTPGVPNISSQRKYWGGFRGGGRRAEPGLRTSRQKELAAAAAKKKKAPSGAPLLFITKKKPSGLLNAPQKLPRRDSALKLGPQKRACGPFMPRRGAAAKKKKAPSGGPPPA